MSDALFKGGRSGEGSGITGNDFELAAQVEKRVGKKIK